MTIHDMMWTLAASFLITIPVLAVHSAVVERLHLSDKAGAVLLVVFLLGGVILGYFILLGLPFLLS